MDSMQTLRALEVRQRQKHAKHQRAYAERKKQKDRKAYDTLLQQIEDIKRATQHMRTFHAQLPEYATSNSIVARRQTFVKLYGEFFKYGSDPNAMGGNDNDIQVAFMASHFTSKSVSTANSHRGYAFLEEQYKMYTFLFDDFLAEPIAPRQLDPEGHTYVLDQRLSMTITSRAIQALFKDLAYDPMFKQKVVGKRLSVDFRTSLRFDFADQVESLSTEASYAEAWFQILGDLKLVSEVLQDFMANASDGFIQSTLHAVKTCNSKRIVELDTKCFRILERERKKRRRAAIEPTDGQKATQKYVKENLPVDGNRLQGLRLILN